MTSDSDRISVLRNGLVVRPYEEHPLLSSHDLWPCSLKVEMYKLHPNRTEPSIGCEVGLIVNLGGPICVEWGHQRPNRPVMFPHGGICLGSPGEPIPAFHWREVSTHAVVHISAELFPAGGYASRFTAPMGSTDERILTLVRLMRAELKAGGPNGPLYGESLGQDLAAHLHQRYASLTKVPATGGLGPQRRRKILDFMESHAGCTPTLSQMAAYLGISVFHFSRAFKQEFGITPYRFFLEQRIDRAKYLLAHSSIDHAEIGKRLGFSSASHFANMFRRSTGLPPNAFRKQHRMAVRVGPR